MSQPFRQTRVWPRSLPPRPDGAAAPGGYRLWEGLNLSRYFDVDFAPDAEPLIRRLSIPARGARLGNSFQGHAAVRHIAMIDHQLLASFARNLPVLERVGIYPEDEFEARLVLGEAAHATVLHEEKAAYAQRVSYLHDRVDIHRARRNVEQLQDLYAGRCQLCLYDPATRYGLRLCHGHHIEWLSMGGEDELANMILVCPNHHSAIHRDCAPFDYGSLGFTFSEAGVEPVRLNLHLAQAA